MDKQQSKDAPAEDKSVQGDSLELAPEDAEKNTIISPTEPQESQPATGSVVTSEPSKSSKSSGKLKQFWQRFNIYMLLFILLLVLGGAGVVVLYFKNRSSSSVGKGSINQQELPASTLQQLAAEGVQVGDPKQVLNIQSNSVFAGAVLVKGELQVAGGLRIGSGSLTLPDVNVGGNAIINQLQTQELGVQDSAQLGEVSVLRNIAVNGNGTFNGTLTTPQLSVGRLQLNGDLNINRHLVAGGATPGRSNGGALGGGGTTSVSGSDSAGSISINTGNGTAAGCFLTVNFTNAFASAPAVIITPVGSAAAGIDYYVNRGTANFSVCTTSPAPANSAFGFDYMTIE